LHNVSKCNKNCDEVSKTKNSKYQVRLPLLLAVAVVAGIFIGATISESGPASTHALNNFYKFREVLSYIQREYVDEVDTDELVESAIEGMLEDLDPHTVYIKAKDRELTNAQLEGEFEGIGIEFNIFKDTLYVVAPLSGGPSEKAGIQTGDKIIKVDGKDFAGVGISFRDVYDNLRGKKGSEVILTIQRKKESELLEFSIIRDKIPQYSVDAAYMVDDEIGYIKVSRFSITTYDEFRTSIKQLKGEGMNKLIIDLQGNPGGIMGSAVNMVDELLSGEALIVFTKGNGGQYDNKMYANPKNKGLFEDKPIIVLIDEGSASASEIVAGALQDNDRALIVGRRSFGKGLVQSPIQLSDGSELRLTISRYYTPSGRSIQKPYDSGTEETYSADLINRYNHGEFFNVDSIKFNDSLKFETIKGRPVYGGGGIMPDFFVPYDTTMNSNYLRQLFIKSVIREYALKYYEENQESLKSMSFKEYNGNFSVDQDMLSELKALAISSGIEYSEEEFNTSRFLIETHLKAQIARSVWNGEGFFPIYNQTNEVFMNALKLFDKASSLIES